MTFEHNNVDRWSGKNFRDRIVKILPKEVFLKNAKLLKNIAGLATSGRHNSAMITTAENLRLNGPPVGCLVSIFKVRINSKSFPCAVRCVQENIFPARISARLRYGITYVHTVAWLRRQTTARSSNRITCNWVNAQKSSLNWKLKVSNTADNAGITQSQARDTRYRRMQELNRLCVSK